MSRDHVPSESVLSYKIETRTITLVFTNSDKEAPTFSTSIKKKEEKKGKYEINEDSEATDDPDLNKRPSSSSSSLESEVTRLTEVVAGLQEELKSVKESMLVCTTKMNALEESVQFCKDLILKSTPVTPSTSSVSSSTSTSTSTPPPHSGSRHFPAAPDGSHPPGWYLGSYPSRYSPPPRHFSSYSQVLCHFFLSLLI